MERVCNSHARIIHSPQKEEANFHDRRIRSLMKSKRETCKTMGMVLPRNISRKTHGTSKQTGLILYMETMAYAVVLSWTGNPDSGSEERGLGGVSGG